MAKPNSWMTLIRMAIVKIVDPNPDKGEAWCVGCRMDPEGRTVIIPADGMYNHARKHAELADHHVKIKGRWPPR